MSIPDDEDGAVLKAIAAQGVDLTQPIVIEFALDAPDDASARSIHKAILAAGCESEIDYDEGEPDEDGEIDPDDEEFGPSWTVFANVQMVPDHGEIILIQHEIDGLARPRGGKSDGWGVMLD